MVLENSVYTKLLHATAGELCNDISRVQQIILHVHVYSFSLEYLHNYAMLTYRLHSIELAFCSSLDR